MVNVRTVKNALKLNLIYVVYHYLRAKRAFAEVISGIQRISKLNENVMQNYFSIGY